MHVRRHGAVHAGELHFVVEIRAVAQAPNHDGCTMLLRGRDSEVVKRGSLEAAASLGGHGAEHLLHHRQPLLGREQRLLAGMDADRDDKLVAQGHGVPDNVQMAIGHGVERTWVEGNAGHAPLPTALGTAPQAGPMAN
jgi:hypothetical protein